MSFASDLRHTLRTSSDAELLELVEECNGWLVSMAEDELRRRVRVVTAR